MAIQPDKRLTVLVTGANGQLGRELRRLSLQASGIRFLFSDVSALPGEETLYLDITNREAVELVCRSERVGAIVNCAAYTDVERAESDAAMADLLNHVAPAHLAAVAAATNALLVQISTDFVFDGKRSEPYPEDWPAAPLGVYGATKLSGEDAVRRSGCRYMIIRTAWLYSPYGKNFVKTMMRLTAERDSLRVVCDQVGTPTYAADLAGFIFSLLSRKDLPSGTWHFTGEGVCSWYDLACAVRDLSGHTGCDIQPCRTRDYPTKARRPAYSVLDKSRVKKDFGVRLPHWMDSLRACMAEMKDNKE